MFIDFGIMFVVIGWNVTLLESMNKRCVFLEHAVSLTGLSNVHVVRGRAEVFYFCLPLFECRFWNVCVYVCSY